MRHPSGGLSEDPAGPRAASTERKAPAEGTSRVSSLTPRDKPTEEPARAAAASLRPGALALWASSWTGKPWVSPQVQAPVPCTPWRQGPRPQSPRCPELPGGTWVSRTTARSPRTPRTSLSLWPWPLVRKGSLGILGVPRGSGPCLSGAPGGSGPAVSGAGESGRMLPGLLAPFEGLELVLSLRSLVCLC